MDQPAGDVGDALGLPLLRLPLPPNPVPEPFKGDPNEEVLLLLGPQLLGWQWQNPDPAAPPLVVRFDATDAAWLAACTHVLSGVANSILAHDPTASIGRVLAAKAALGATPVPEDGYVDFENFAEAFAKLEGAVNQPPDAARDKAAKDHSLAMISGTRRFWTLVAAETDNDREGIPKGGQTSALGITLPPRHWRKLAWRPGRRRGASASVPPSPLLARGGGPGPDPRPHVRRARANVDHRLAPGLGRRVLSRKGAR
jgi:hypothetical protein